MSNESIIRGCGCSSDEACNLCGFEACQLAWLNNTELKQQLSDQQALIEKQKKVIEILSKSNDFYADRSSWSESEHPTHEYYAGAIKNDDSLVEYTEADGDKFKDYYGGKKARQAKKQAEEILK